MAKVRKGFINPSFIVDIIPDAERWNRHMNSVPGIKGSEEFMRLREERASEGVKKLSEMFPKREDLKRLK